MDNYWGDILRYYVWEARDYLPAVISDDTQIITGEAAMLMQEVLDEIR